MASLGNDYGFLDLDQAAFDLTDRGVKGRPEGGGLDAYVFTERGVYRSGETVQIAALLRDARGSAVADLPLTLVVKRPDGVEYRGFPWPIRGSAGGPCPLHSSCRGRCTARGGSRPIPTRRPPRWGGELPAGRLRPRAARRDTHLRLPQPDAGRDGRNRGRRPLPLRRAGFGVDVSGSVTVQAASGNGIKGLDGFTVGLDDEAVEARRGNSPPTPPRMRRARRRSPCRCRRRRTPAARGEDHPGGGRARRAGALAQRGPADPALGPVLALRKGFSD